MIKSEPLIFALSDVQTVKDVSVQIEQNSFEKYAQEVQNNYVVKLLSPKLYKAVIHDLENEKFQALLNGCYFNDDEERHLGVINYCANLWLYVYLLNSDVQFTPLGARVFKDSYETNVNPQQVLGHYSRTANGIETDLVRYIRQNKDFSRYRKIKTPAKNNDFSFRVMANSYAPPDEFTDVL